MTRRTLLLLLVLLSSLVAAGQTTRAGRSVKSAKSLPAQQTAPKPMTNQDVIKMVSAGLSEQVVISSIHNAKLRSFELTPDALIDLKRSKVPDSVISAMQHPDAVPELPAPQSAAVAVPQPPKPTFREIKVADGTAIKLKLLTAVSSGTANQDDPLELEAAEDVLVDGVTVIRKGAKAFGHVTAAQKKKSFGRRGKLDLVVEYVTGVDDQKVRVRGSKQRQGDESYGTAGVVTLLAGPFGALVKGKDVEIPAGTELNIFSDGDRSVKIAEQSASIGKS